MKRLALIACIAIVSLSLFASCDSVLPGDPGTLVVEAYLDVGKPLPTIRVKYAAPLSSSRFLDQKDVEDAHVRLSLNDQFYDYVYAGDSKGVYEPAGNGSVIVPPGAVYALTVQVGDHVASASGVTPFAISIQDVSIQVGLKPVAAVLLDSLDLGLDSLNISLNTRTGYIYPVQVSIDWLAEDASLNSWIESSLNPITPFSSTIVDFFLLPSAIFSEESAQIDGALRRWEGVYAVPVSKESDPLPVHELRVALLRSSDVFAQYASSRLDPVGREPISNLIGAVGFVGGVSIDSVRVSVPKQ
ncbi:DUF4249 family protein [bacterium]|nr:DUF4249 family protein [bacterium]